MNSKLFTFLALFIILIAPAFSQQITGKIIDTKTKDPIPFSTIQFDEFNGVVSNSEGFYILSVDGFEDTKTFTMSCLGYIAQTMSFQQLKSKNFIIALDPSVKKFSTAYLNNSLPDVDSIMKRVKTNLKQNYNSSLTKNKLFSRQTEYFKADDVAIKLKKSSGFRKNQLKESNRQLDSLTTRWVNSPANLVFTDLLGDYYSFNDVSSKMHVIKATELLDIEDKNAYDNLQKKATYVILKHLDVDKTYKLKSGLFFIEDSLSLIASKRKTEETLIYLDGVKQNANQFINQHLFGSSSLFDFVSDTSIYDYTIEDITYMDSKPVFIIHFEPRKNRAKYAGNLYIGEDDYAVLRVDYKFAKGKKGKSVNLKYLFGVKYSENVRNGTVIYKKNIASNFYYPYYINQEIGRYPHLRRPLQFIENGGEKKIIVFDFKVDGNIIQKREILTFSNEAITQETYKALNESKTVEYVKLKKYDPFIWKDHTVLEPLEEMKQFNLQ